MKRNGFLFIQSQTQPLSKHHKWKENIGVYVKQPWEIIGEQLPTQSSLDNSIV